MDERFLPFCKKGVVKCGPSSIILAITFLNSQQLISCIETITLNPGAWENSQDPPLLKLKQLKSPGRQRHFLLWYNCPYISHTPVGPTPTPAPKPHFCKTVKFIASSNQTSLKSFLWFVISAVYGVNRYLSP